MPTTTLKTELKPTQYAEELGQGFIDSQNKGTISELGQFFTPGSIAAHIARNFDTSKIQKSVRILDPGAGSGVLSCALCEYLAQLNNRPNRIELTAYEVDPSLIATLSSIYSNLEAWLAERDITLQVSIRNKDFVLDNARVLERTLQKQLFENTQLESYDFVVANPPYFKIPKNDPRAEATSSIIHGQPNIYALFMALSAGLLNENGQLGFITPRSYTSGLYFKRFRQHFFDLMTPTNIHIFESRDKVFNKDGVLQENVILHATKKQQGTSRDTVRISSCNDLRDLETPHVIKVPLHEIITRQNGYVLHIPTQTVHRDIVKLISSWDQNLHSLGLEVSTGPIVAFRAKDLLLDDGVIDSHAPLLWLQNVRPMQVTWPVENRKPKYVQIVEASKSLLLPTNNYVLVRRFSAKEEKRRLVAAPLFRNKINSEHVGLENHLNYIYKKDGSLTEVEAAGLAAIFNSSLFDSYFRIFSGNTQVSATELRSFPLPSKKVIRTVGVLAKKSKNIEEDDEKIVNVIKQHGN